MASDNESLSRGVGSMLVSAERDDLHRLSKECKKKESQIRNLTNCYEYETKLKKELEHKFDKYYYMTLWQRIKYVFKIRPKQNE